MLLQVNAGVDCRNWKGFYFNVDYFCLFFCVLASDNDKLESFFIMLLTFLHGKTLGDVKLSQSQLNALAYESGVAFAKIDQELMVRCDEANNLTVFLSSSYFLKGV